MDENVPRHFNIIYLYVRCSTQPDARISIKLKNVPRCSTKHRRILNSHTPSTVHTHLSK